MSQWIDDKLTAIDPKSNANLDDEQLKSRQRRQEALNAELEAAKKHLDALMKQGSDLSESSEAAEAKKSIEDQLENLKAKWNELEQRAKDNAEALEEAGKQNEWLTDMKEFDMWMDEARAVIENAPEKFDNLEAAQNAEQKHGQKIEEIDAAKDIKDKLENHGKNLLEEDRYDPEVINGKIRDQDDKYKALQALANRKEKNLQDEVAGLELLGTIDNEFDYLDGVDRNLEGKKAPDTLIGAENDKREIDGLSDELRKRKERQLGNFRDGNPDMNSEAADKLKALERDYDLMIKKAGSVASTLSVGSFEKNIFPNSANFFYFITFPVIHHRRFQEIQPRKRST